MPFVPETCTHNAHMFYIKTRDLKERTQLIQYLEQHEIKAVFHYVPLHSSKAGRKFGEFVGKDRYTTKESERIVRLPMYYSLKNEEVEYVADCVQKFYSGR